MWLIQLKNQEMYPMSLIPKEELFEGAELTAGYDLQLSPVEQTTKSSATSVFFHLIHSLPSEGGGHLPLLRARDHGLNQGPERKVPAADRPHEGTAMLRPSREVKLE